MPIGYYAKGDRAIDKSRSLFGDGACEYLEGENCGLEEGDEYNIGPASDCGLKY